MAKQAWHAHVEACRAILRHWVLDRLELGREAAEYWGDTCTVNGVLHLREKLMLDLGKRRFAHIEFVASPKSMVIACEGERPSSRKRWPRIALSTEAVRLHADAAIREFLVFLGGVVDAIKDSVSGSRPEPQPFSSSARLSRGPMNTR